MANLLYVDNSNVWIEGMRFSAVKKGMAADIWTAMNNGVTDQGWMIDFGRLFGFAGGDKEEVRKATLFGSRPPENDSLWDMARKNGFEVVVYDRNVAGKEKKVDTDIAATMIEDSFVVLQQGDEVTLVAGDADYVPVVEKLKARGIPVCVVFWSHSSKELREAASSFVDLDPYLDHLTL